MSCTDLSLVLPLQKRMALDHVDVLNVRVCLHCIIRQHSYIFPYFVSKCDYVILQEIVILTVWFFWFCSMTDYVMRTCIVTGCGVNMLVFLSLRPSVGCNLYCQLRLLCEFSIRTKTVYCISKHGADSIVQRSWIGSMFPITFNICFAALW
jgi:hypothetical protein